MFLNKLQLIMDKMNDIKYGFVDNNKNIYPDNDKNWDNNFQTKYFLQSPQNLIKTKHGVCWDQVELERYYLQINNIKCDSYFIINYDGKIFPTHTFIIINNENNYYWFEHSWQPHKGIHKYKTLNEALLSVNDKFNTMLKNKYNIVNKDTVIYNYTKPNYNIKAEDFFKYCESGKKILLEENDYKLINATISDIERIKKYKFNTTLEYAQNLEKAEINRINDYVENTIKNQINEYQNIIINNKIVGSILLTKKENNLLLDEIFIEEQYRNKGIGTSIIKNSISKTNNNINLWVYKENVKAIKLYKKLGFTIKDETDSRYYMEYVKKQTKK